jgi:hypothetical protein
VLQCSYSCAYKYFLTYTRIYKYFFKKKELKNNINAFSVKLASIFFFIALGF